MHGFNRTTGDLDIIISLEDDNIKKFISIAQKLDLVPRLPVKLEDFAIQEVRRTWVKEKNLKVFTVYNPNNPLEHIDVKISQFFFQFYAGFSNISINVGKTGFAAEAARGNG